jgi:hypothetical protein
LDAIKLATPEQVERIASTSDLGPTSAVYAMGEDIAVVKHVVEIDPVYFNETSNTSRRLMFVWGLENVLRITGFPAYYFNCLETAEAWRHVVETNGAKAISIAPEIRYKKDLL